MDAPGADSQIVSGIYGLDGPTWRWMSTRAVVLLKSPAAPRPLEVEFHLPIQAPGRRLELWLDDKRVAEAFYATPGTYTFSTKEPVAPAGETATVTLTVDRPVLFPQDQRELGIVLRAIGFKR